MASLRLSRARSTTSPKSANYALPTYFHSSSMSNNDMLPLTHSHSTQTLGNGSGGGGGGGGGGNNSVPKTISHGNINMSSNSTGNLHYASSAGISGSSGPSSSPAGQFTSRAYSHHHNAPNARIRRFLFGDKHQFGFCGKPFQAMVATIFFVIFVVVISSDDVRTWELGSQQQRDLVQPRAADLAQQQKSLPTNGASLSNSHFPSQTPGGNSQTDPSRRQQQQQQQQLASSTLINQGQPMYDSHFLGAVQSGYFHPEDATMPDHTSFKFVAITDLDRLSLVPDAKKPSFRAELLSGIIHRDSAHVRGGAQYSIAVGESREIVTRHNEAGRGAEYSDLVLYERRLLTVDDRTGALVEILNSNDGASSRVIPRTVFMEGDGTSSDKGMKWEWSAVKDGELYLGSIGKEYTNRDGSIRSMAPLWVVIISPNGQVRRENWTSKYDYIRKVMHAQYPGYLVQEAVRWSEHLRNWVVLPRRISKHEYVAALDERLGSNKIVLINEDFTDSTVIQVDYHDSEAGLRGFAAFSFVPNTKDHHALIVRSVEEDCAGDTMEELWRDCKQRTYLSVLEVTTGNILMEEVEFHGKLKFEGIEFVDIDTKPPPMLPQSEADAKQHENIQNQRAAGDANGSIGAYDGASAR